MILHSWFSVFQNNNHHHNYHHHHHHYVYVFVTLTVFESTWECLDSLYEQVRNDPKYKSVNEKIFWIVTVVTG